MQQVKIVLGGGVAALTGCLSVPVAFFVIGDLQRLLQADIPLLVQTVAIGLVVATPAVVLLRWRLVPAAVGLVLGAAVGWGLRAVHNLSLCGSGALYRPCDPGEWLLPALLPVLFVILAFLVTYHGALLRGPGSR